MFNRYGMLLGVRGSWLCHELLRKNGGRVGGGGGGWGGGGGGGAGGAGGGRAAWV